jgi:hypothetical protein
MFAVIEITASPLTVFDREMKIGCEPTDNLVYAQLHEGVSICSDGCP